MKDFEIEFCIENVCILDINNHCNCMQIANAGEYVVSSDNMYENIKV